MNDSAKFIIYDLLQFFRFVVIVLYRRSDLKNLNLFDFAFILGGFMFFRFK